MAELIILHAVEAEKDCALNLNQLKLQANERIRKTIPFPHFKLPLDVTMLVIQSSPAECSDLDVSSYIKLVPPFREAEVDCYFIAFKQS